MLGQAAPGEGRSPPTPGPDLGHREEERDWQEAAGLGADLVCSGPVLACVSLPQSRSLHLETPVLWASSSRTPSCRWSWAQGGVARAGPLLSLQPGQPWAPSPHGGHDSAPERYPRGLAARHEANASEKRRAFSCEASRQADRRQAQNRLPVGSGRDIRGFSAGPSRQRTLRCGKGPGSGPVLVLCSMGWGGGRGGGGRKAGAGAVTGAQGCPSVLYPRFELGPGSCWKQPGRVCAGSEVTHVHPLWPGFEGELRGLNGRCSERQSHGLGCYHGSAPGFAALWTVQRSPGSGWAQLGGAGLCLPRSLRCPSW